jgi:hypothetical protein
MKMLHTGLREFSLMKKIRMIKVILKLTITIPLQQYHQALAVLEVASKITLIKTQNLII